MDYPRMERRRSSFDSNVESPRIPHRMSFDSPSSMRYSSNADLLRSSFDARDISRGSLDLKDAVRGSLQAQRDRPRASLDGSLLRESPRFGQSRPKESPRFSVDAQRASMDSPRLSMRLKEAVRAAVEGRQDPVRSSFDAKEALRSSQDKESSSSMRSASINRSSRDNRLLVELQESPRLSRDAPRYSFDGKDVRSSTDPRYSFDGRDVRSSSDSFRDSLRGAAQKARESPRLSVDGYGPRRLSVDDAFRSEMEGGREEPRRRVPSVVARLMGLEDLPDERPSPPPPPQQIVLPHQIPGLPKKPSKESKLLKGLLLYNPRSDNKSLNDTRLDGDEENQDRLTLKHIYTPRQQHQTDNVRSHQQPGAWNGIPDSPGQLKQSSPRHLGMETMPSADKHQQEVREIEQKVVRAMPKQLTEAVLTVLKKNSDDGDRMPMSYADMENRLRQLRLRSTLQDHKTLRQILEAMQSKGLLTRASRPKEIPIEHESVQLLLQEERRPRLLHEQVFGSTSPDEGVAVSNKPNRSPEEQQQSQQQQQQAASGASIVVMKPIGKPVKKKTRSQNPALLIEGMPSARSPQRSREAGKPTSPWGSPVNRSARTQPGYGFGREPTGRFNSEETAAFRRERTSARSASRDVQSEPTMMMPKSPKMIALPQSTGKFRSPSGTRDAPDSLRNVKVISSTVNKTGESGRKARSPSIKEDNSQQVSRSQSLGLLKKKPVPEPEQKDDQRTRRSASSESKLMTTSLDREASSKSTQGPAQVTVLRNRTSMGKRITLPEPEVRTPTTKRVVGNGTRSGGAEEKPKERSPILSQSNSAPSTPRGSLRSGGDYTKEDELGARLSHVRVTNGDATDQCSGRSPLVGLTNRLQSAEIGLGELDRDGHGVRTPRAGIVAKKRFSNQEEANSVADIVAIVAEQQPQASPVSVLDGTAFGNVTLLTPNKTEEDAMQGNCAADTRDSDIVWQADTPTPEEFRGEEDEEEEEDVAVVAKDVVPVEDRTQQDMLLRESAAILPPQGQVEPIILQSHAEKAYVRDVLVVSGATMGMKAARTSGCIIDSTVFDYLEERQSSPDYGVEQSIEDTEKLDGDKSRQVVDRRMLFDCVNDVLATLLVPFVHSEPWTHGIHVQPLRKRPMGQTLVQQLWDEIQSLPPQKPCEDICDSLYSVLQKDLMQSRNSWSDFSYEIGDIGLEVEKMLFNDLVDEALFDVGQRSHRKGLEVH